MLKLLAGAVVIAALGVATPAAAPRSAPAQPAWLLPWHWHLVTDRDGILRQVISTPGYGSYVDCRAGLLAKLREVAGRGGMVSDYFGVPSRVVGGFCRVEGMQT